MEKKEFTEKFASSESTKERNEKAAKASMGMVKFGYERDIPSIDFCEICIHPKGRTMNVYEMCASYEDIDITEFELFKNRSEDYCINEFGPGCHVIPNIVIPPDPKMIMELGEHVKALKEMDIIITIYDPKNDKKGSFPINEEFFGSLREDEEYRGMSDSEIFQNYMMNFAEML
jgi:hypothetical protein